MAEIPDTDYAPSALPPTGARIAAFAAILLAGLCGGLIGYGPNRREMFRQVAGYVDRILRGARPRDLPVQEASKLDLVINLRTARALGLTIRPSVLQRASEVAIVSTCNRTELYVGANRGLVAPAVDWLAGVGGVSAQTLREHAYVLEGGAARYFEDVEAAIAHHERNMTRR